MRKRRLISQLGLINSRGGLLIVALNLDLRDSVSENVVPLVYDSLVAGHIWDLYFLKFAFVVRGGLVVEMILIVHIDGFNSWDVLDGSRLVAHHPLIIFRP